MWFTSAPTCTRRCTEAKSPLEQAATNSSPSLYFTQSSSLEFVAASLAAMMTADTLELCDTVSSAIYILLFDVFN
jgi:hypothetical protein